jgi:hypothetical protein
VATAFLGQPHQLLRSALLACNAKGLTGTVAATNDPSPLTFFLESRANSTHSGFAHQARSYVVSVADFANTERNSSEGAVEPGPIFMLVHRASSTTNQVQATSLLWLLRAQISFSATTPWYEKLEADHSNAGFILDSFNDHFNDRLKMLLLSNRKGDIFEELAIHIAFAPGFVNLYEFSKLHAKIRGSPYC